MHIGILDDNPAILDFLSTTLGLAGYTVSTHATALSFLEALFPEGQEGATLPYDLVLLDLLLPGDMSGIDVYRLIRLTVPVDRLPIIFMTAASEDYIRYMQAGLPEVPLLRKPFPIRNLLQAIRMFTETRREGDRASNGEREGSDGRG